MTLDEIKFLYRSLPEIKKRWNHFCSVCAFPSDDEDEENALNVIKQDIPALLKAFEIVIPELEAAIRDLGVEGGCHSCVHGEFSHVSEANNKICKSCTVRTRDKSHPLEYKWRGDQWKFM